MKHVIIGAGPAGVIAAETLRKVDPSSNVIIVGDEPEPPYSRMALPYYLIERINEQGTYLRKDSSHFSSQNIDVIRDRVSEIDTKSKSLKLDNNDSISFDKLLLATGSHPIRPPIEGMDLPGIHSCWTLEDGRNIIKRARPGANVVLMGAGFIGCIILEALAAREVNLTVVEMGDRMVPRMMDQTAGNLIKDWCQKKGVNVHTSTRIEAIEQGN
ncbi:MAG: NAD(P)/FAD-dependent oxidoreductase, partial [Proteobacteria bacterium]|nr:NAD(P)/FAD-dependent oxidoreductase [Pseudomonadota bacterium]